MITIVQVFLCNDEGARDPARYPGVSAGLTITDNFSGKEHPLSLRPMTRSGGQGSAFGIFVLHSMFMSTLSAAAALLSR